MTARQQAIFTLDELAAYLKVGKRTLYRLASHGEIPAFKVGGGCVPSSGVTSVSVLTDSGRFRLGQ